jgi:hypothetical protein
MEMYSLKSERIENALVFEDQSDTTEFIEIIHRHSSVVQLQPLDRIGSVSISHNQFMDLFDSYSVDRREVVTSEKYTQIQKHLRVEITKRIFEIRRVDEIPLAKTCEIALLVHLQQHSLTPICEKVRVLRQHSRADTFEEQIRHLCISLIRSHNIINTLRFQRTKSKNKVMNHLVSDGAGAFEALESLVVLSCIEVAPAELEIGLTSVTTDVVGCTFGAQCTTIKDNNNTHSVIEKKVGEMQTVFDVLFCLLICAEFDTAGESRSVEPTEAIHGYGL